MENKSHALAAGAFVLAVAAMLIGLALWLTREASDTRSYVVVTSDAITGLQPQAQVQYKGVSVGKVTHIGFDTDNPGYVRIQFAIAPDTPVSANTYAQLAYQGVTGLSFVQLTDDGVSNGAPALGPDGLPRIPLRPNALGQITENVNGLMVKVEQATDGLNTLLGDANQKAFTEALVNIAKNVQHVGDLAQATNRILSAQLDPARADVPKLLAQGGAALQAVQAAAQEASRSAAAVTALVQEAQKGLTRVTGPGGVIERLDESANTVTSATLPRIQALTNDASRTIRRLDRIANALSDNPQALLYGPGAAPPGPGEAGFASPAAAPASAAALP